MGHLLLWSLDPTLCGHARWGILNTQTSAETETPTGINEERGHLGKSNLLCPLCFGNFQLRLVAWFDELKSGTGWFKNMDMEVKRSCGFYTQWSKRIITYWEKYVIDASGCKILRSITSYRLQRRDVKNRLIQLWENSKKSSWFRYSYWQNSGWLPNTPFPPRSNLGLKET